MVINESNRVFNVPLHFMCSVTKFNVPANIGQVLPVCYTVGILFLYGPDI